MRENVFRIFFTFSSTRLHFSKHLLRVLIDVLQCISPCCVGINCDDIGMTLAVWC